ncbi:MAG: LptF/LptG family permease [Bacteroidota bacterium]|nr:LptF/LptG family permease [Bacteroidota bacterium]MDP4205229.1 LptF/LptG family permease [Bacteroidota bacterium]
MLKKIDIYIIRKFLGTFFYAIALIISIAIIFDFSEKIDDFVEKNATMHQVIFDYYMNFIPYFANLFSGLFTFIAVIFFTSKMAYNSEITAILSSGITYRRMMRPYLISAAVIALFSWTLSNFIIPPANKVKIKFENTFINTTTKSSDDANIHMELAPNVYVYMQSFSSQTKTGYKFTIEKFNDRQELRSKLSSETVQYDTVKHVWRANNYFIRTLDGEKEKLIYGTSIDTTLSILPTDFNLDKNAVETFNLFQLNRYIKEQKSRGLGNVILFEIERNKRTAACFSAFILTIIGVSLASRRVRGGLGLHLGLGMLLSFSYIMFQQVTKVFALSGALPPMIATWIPNIIYTIIAIILYRRASN